MNDSNKVKLTLETWSSETVEGSPDSVNLYLSQTQIDKIIRLSKAVAPEELDVHEICFFYNAEYLSDGEDTRIDLSKLHVTRTEFWLSGFVKHTDVFVHSEKVQISTFTQN